MENWYGGLGNVFYKAQDRRKEYRGSIEGYLAQKAKQQQSNNVAALGKNDLPNIDSGLQIGIPEENEYFEALKKNARFF